MHWKVTLFPMCVKATVKGSPEPKLNAIHHLVSATAKHPTYGHNWHTTQGTPRGHYLHCDFFNMCICADQQFRTTHILHMHKMPCQTRAENKAM